MNARLVRPADYQTMPWKNGCGITHQIAIERSAEDEQTGRFVWRLSMAEVGSSAPFSIFAGYDRTIVLLAGDGMVLDRGPAGRHLLAQKFEPYSFPGEWEIDGQLFQGPCLDFNVIVDRSQASASVRVLTLNADQQRVKTIAPTVALFSCQGSVLFTSNGSEFEIPSQHTLLMYPLSQPSEFGICATQREAVALLVEFSH